MAEINTDHLIRTFRKGDGQNESIIKEQINVLTEELNKVKHSLQDLKDPVDADKKIKRTVNGIREFVHNCAMTELHAIDSVKKAKYFAECLECVLHQLKVTEKNPKDMYDNLVAVIVNLNGVAQVFTTKEESGKDMAMDGWEKERMDKYIGSTNPMKMKQQIEHLQREDSELMIHQQKEKEAIHSPFEDSRKLREKIADLESNNAELKKQLQLESDAKQDALNRFSKLAGEKMKIGNPDIADLSDPNRPLKLSEEFSELYCNEWTDALEYLQKKATKGNSSFKGRHTIHIHGRPLETEENGSIKILLEALKNCYVISKEHADYQRIAILNAMTGTAERDVKPIMTSGFKTDVDNQKIEDAVREFQRNLGTETVKVMPKIVSQNVLSKFDHHQGDKMFIYVEKCAQLCWLMRIQFPPIHLDFDIKMGTQFDSKLYKQYVTSGNTVLFPVWPAMFLTENNGALLGKGVVECVTNK